LNEMKLDEQELAEVEVSEQERQQVKQSLRAAIRRKPRRRAWVRPVAAVALLLTLGGAAIGATFPAYAANIPLVGDIFKLVDERLNNGDWYTDYKTYSTEMNMSAESNGIKITLGDAVFDGKTVTLAYTLESDRDLGERPMIQGFPDIRGSNGGGGSQVSFKLEEGKYAGILNADSVNHNGVDHIKLRWRIDGISIMESKERIEGDWRFALALDATEQSVQLVDQSLEQDGVKLTIDKLVATPMTTILSYRSLISEEVYADWDAVDIELTARDDLGHEYASRSGSSKGTNQDGGMAWAHTQTLEKLNPEASKLIVTPTLRYYVHTKENHGGIDENGKSYTGSDKPAKEDRIIVLDDIVIPLTQ